MNLARLFAYTLEVERQRDEFRERARQLEAEQKQFVDALSRSSGKPAVFERSTPETTSSVPAVAFGPTASLARQEAKEREEEAEILRRADEARRNGGSVSIPQIPKS